MVCAVGWGTIASPSVLEAPAIEHAGNFHLRSSAELRNRYSLRAEDGKVGRVRDFIMDDQNWSVPYAIVRAGVLRPRQACPGED